MKCQYLRRYVEPIFNEKYYLYIETTTKSIKLPFKNISLLQYAYPLKSFISKLVIMDYRSDGNKS